MSNPELDAKVIEGQPQAAQPTVNIALNINELNVILASLQELPHKVADPLLRNIMGQAQSQLQQ